jgi:hypothetical protein
MTQAERLEKIKQAVTANHDFVILSASGATLVRKYARSLGLTVTALFEQWGSGIDPVPTAPSARRTVVRVEINDEDDVEQDDEMDDSTDLDDDQCDPDLEDCDEIEGDDKHDSDSIREREDDDEENDEIDDREHVSYTPSRKRRG